MFVVRQTCFAQNVYAPHRLMTKGLQKPPRRGGEVFIKVKTKFRQAWHKPSPWPGQLFGQARSGHF